MPAPPQPAEKNRKNSFINFADNLALFPHNHRISPDPGIDPWRHLLGPPLRALGICLGMRATQMNWRLYKMRSFRIKYLQKQAPRNPFAMTYLA
jgi:hypothetical protein